MKVHHILPCVLLSSQTRTVLTSHTRIMGGAPAEAGEFPYVVSLHNFGIGYFCGGSLIARDVVLTAAHCSSPFSLDKAIVGRRDLDADGGQEINVASTLLHPEYNSVNNDIMLVFLQDPADPDRELVRLNADESSPNVGNPVTVAGYGVTDLTAPDVVADVLMAVEVNAISNKDCEQSNGFVGLNFESYEGIITDAMLCAKDDGEDACQGDSGGPLVMEGAGGSSDVQVGVVSWGIGCAHSDFPGVYARVSTFYDWIKEEVCKESSYPPVEFDCNDAVPSPSPQCTDTPYWVDSYGDVCGWYEKYDQQGCPLYGHIMGAIGNCCHCGDVTGTLTTGGSADSGSPTSSPTSSPTIAPTTPSSTLSPTPSTTLGSTNDDSTISSPTWSPTLTSSSGAPSIIQSCTDTPDWTDAYGDGCEWYEANDDSGCPLYGFTGAIGNCCHCGDSKRSFYEVGELWEAFLDGVSELFGAFVTPAIEPTDSPTPTPESSPTTPSPTLSATLSATLSPTSTSASSRDFTLSEPPSPVQSCTDTPNWTDAYGDGCEWYEENDFPGCKLFGDDYGGALGVSGDNCCYCGQP